MKLKGTAKITLRDAKTGRIVKEEEHSNAITPALQAIFDNNLAGTVDFSKLTPIMSRLLGGVILWRGNVYSSDIYLPKQENAKITAHAGSDTSASGDSTKGTLNTNPAATGPVPNGYKWTWDWTTSNGNGNITALSLVHEDVGNDYNQNRSGSGFGFSPVEDISNYIINANDFVPDTSVPDYTDLPCAVGTPDQEKIPIGFYGDKNHVVSFSLEETDSQGPMEEWRDGTVHFYVSKFTGTNVWLRNSIADIDIEKTVNVDIDNLLGWQFGSITRYARACFYVAYDETNKHAYLLQCASGHSILDPGPAEYCNDWLTIWDIDLVGETVERRKVRLPASGDDQWVFRSNEGEYIPIQLHIEDGCVFLPIYLLEWIPTGDEPGQGYYDYANLPTSSSLGVRVNLRTATLEGYFDGCTIATQGANAISNNCHVDLGKERSMYPGVIIEKLGASETRGGRSYTFYSEPVTRENKIFGTDNNKNRTYVASTASSLIQFATRCTYSGDGGVDQLRGAILNKMYMASVFPLAMPVAKTSATTMTVEYTVTQAEDEES